MVAFKLCHDLCITNQLLSLLSAFTTFCVTKRSWAETALTISFYHHFRLLSHVVERGKAELKPHMTWFTHLWLATSKLPAKGFYHMLWNEEKLNWNRIWHDSRIYDNFEASSSTKSSKEKYKTSSFVVSFLQPTSFWFFNLLINSFPIYTVIHSSCPPITVQALTTSSTRPLKLLLICI